MAKLLSLTLNELEALDPCDFETRKALFPKSGKLNVRQAIKAGFSIRDILWVAQKTGRKELCIKFALACAQRVVQYDKSGTGQPCLDAVAAYIDNPTSDNLNVMIKARSAAYAADAYAYANAADAAAAAAAAAYAAYAADAAANAADAAAAAAAAYAAYAADAAANAARQKEVEEQKKLLIQIFIA